MTHNSINVYGITGTIGSGKTTIVDYLREKHGFSEYSFASPLKDMAKCIGFTHTQVYGTQEQKLEINEHWGISGRVFLQKFGTDIIRDILPSVIPEMRTDKSVWIKLFKIHMSNLEKSIPDLENVIEKNIVVGDVRFVDEGDVIHEYKGCMIRVLRPEKYFSHDENMPLNHESNHKSELESLKIPVDCTIYNDGSLKDLYDKLDILMSGNEFESMLSLV